jgi:hypothetical protein
MSVFLSSDWFEAVAEIGRRHPDQRESASPVTISYKVTSVPFDPGVVELHLDNTAGQGLDIKPGPLAGADVTLESDYATAKLFLVGQDDVAIERAFMTGAIRVGKGMNRLMELDLPDDENTRAAAAELQAVTD